MLRVDRWPELPDPAAYSFVVALGSYASLAEPWTAWVAREVEWLGRAVIAGVPILGICFGAQALAVALGGEVARLPSPEFAWIELDTKDPERIPTGPWLALHEDTITSPPFADELARSESGTQAFAAGPHLGVQFHPEATRSMLSRWIGDRGAPLAPVGSGLLAGLRERGHAAGAAAIQLFDGFVTQAGVRIRTASIERV